MFGSEAAENRADNVPAADRRPRPYCSRRRRRPAAQPPALAPTRRGGRGGRSPSLSRSRGTAPQAPLLAKQAAACRPEHRLPSRRPPPTRAIPRPTTRPRAIFGALIEAIDLAQLAKLDADWRAEIRDIVSEIIGIKAIVMSISEQEELLDDIWRDVLGCRPLEPLRRATTSPTSWSALGTTYIEVRADPEDERFRDKRS